MTERIIRPNAGHILMPRRFVDVGMPQSRVSAKGRYQLIKRDAWGVEIERTPWFDNLILDAGLNRWGTGSIISGAAIGTGTTAPATTDAGLETLTHYTTTSGTGSGITVGGSPNYNNTRTFVYRTTLGSLNGNYSEVGVGWGSTTMFSRALILDGGGSPTTISVTSVQQLDIVYQLSVYPPLTDWTDTVTISGVDYAVTGRASSVTATSGTAGSWPVSTSLIAVAIGVGGSSANAFTGALGNITSSPSGTRYEGSVTAGTDSYVNNSLQATGYESYSLTQGNLTGGIKSTKFWWNTAAFQYEFSTAIPKDGTKTLSLNYSVTWGRRP
jgi:hypothetical protein